MIKNNANININSSINNANSITIKNILNNF